MQSNQEHKLPPGFRFHPTDEELILHYLRNQATSMPCPVSIIAEIDIYKFDPWELPAKAMFGEKEWYFFSPRDRKYPNGARPNRAAVSGYWKATGTDKPIVTTGRNENIGVKKALVFYKGRPPKGQKTNWIMHEYRLIETSNMGSCRLIKHRDSSMRLDDWVLCRIYEKNSHLPLSADQEHEEVSSEDTFQPNLPCENTFRFHESPSISDFFDKLDASMSSQFEINDDNNRNSDRNATESTFPKLGLIKSFNNFHQPRTHSASYTFNNDDPLHQNQNISQAGSTVTSMDNQLKRRRQMVENYSTPGSVHPLKKLNNSCISTNFNNQLVSSQSFFDAHILMNSQYGLQ